MQRLLIVLIVVVLTACNPAAKEGEHPSGDSAVCEGLDSIFISIENFQKQAEDSVWNSLDVTLADLTRRLKANLDTASAACSYLNMRHRPDVDRFYFIELLKERILEDTLSQGLLYLIKLRGVFIADKEIAEYLSEELAHVAASNPSAYLRYYMNNPGQQEMLLHGTRWNNINADTVVSRFSKLDGGTPIAEYLENWKKQRILENIP